MKKAFISVLTVSLLLSVLIPFAETEAQESSLVVSTNPPSVQVYGAKINSPAPFVKDGVTWVPFRAVAEAYNFRVEWDDDTKTVILIDYTGLASFFVIDGINAVIVDSRTFVPYDFLTGLNFDDNNLMKRLGYSKEYISVIVNEDREIFRKHFTEPNETWNLRKITRGLPYPSGRRYQTSDIQLEPLKSIIVEYELDEDSPYQGGNGLNPFYETGLENNALILFAMIEDLEQVNFLHYFGEERNSTNTYTLDELSERFGAVNPLEMDVEELYSALSANIQISEFYFAHYSRIYLGADFDSVSYRNGNPDEVRQYQDNSVEWLYNDLGKTLNNPGCTAYYYFNSPLAEQNDNLNGLYATKFSVNDGESYLELIAYLGFPSVIKDMGNGYKYIAYPLREGQQRYAYFILRDEIIITEGVMYGTDYTTLNFQQ
ncbi:MAG: copper amine oxidase N-terminal domain-containing protein [Oscillospiraceae bacterium]|nr:copper amine oxidase N-terminal domain-containing protein [Oscillospiraceae bacterium]